MGGKRLDGNYQRLGQYRLNLTSWHERCQPDAASDCVLWTGARHRQGYGMTNLFNATRNENQMTTSHRVAVMLELNRELTRDEYVIHKCLNQLCVNPDHLLLGDKYTKMAVMLSRGRHNPGHRRGHVSDRKQNRQYRYSEAEIRWIRTASTQDIADRYAIDRARAGRMRWGFRAGYKWCR